MSDGFARVNPHTDADWELMTQESLRCAGFAVVEDALSPGEVTTACAAVDRAVKAAKAQIGEARMTKAGELGVGRLPMTFDPYFFRLFSRPEILTIIHAMLGEWAILNLQQAFALPSLDPHDTPEVFQNKYHMDMARVLGPELCSLNVMVVLTPFTAQTGATRIVPGSHNLTPRPDPAYLERFAISAEAPAGSLVFFDSTLWHAAGRNTSGAPRYAVNHQYTKPWLKQQFDFPAILGERVVMSQPEMVRRLLGWRSRPPASLEAFYAPEPQARTFWPGQG